jgi:bisphosphoglycerate-independent phosphoglycerate mutase (AlkP superfamily)
LLVNFDAGYRASWETALGGVPETCFSDNRRCWAGDHIVDPQLVPGVLFTNRTFKTDNPRLIDLAPTILDAFGHPKEDEMEGESLLA